MMHRQSEPMRRDISKLVQDEFDLLIVGGGIFGVCALWDASLRGLKAALIEKKDFAHATSANHFKMVHGGIRYLQHADLHRIRESSRERSALLRIAPHMINPLPILIPTYGRGIKGKALLSIGMRLYDLLTCDRNINLGEGKIIPSSRFISKEMARQYFPGLDSKQLTGAAVFCDGQMYNPPRLALAFLRSAVAVGAEAANYVEATTFLFKNKRVYGVRARDALTGQSFDVRAKMIINAAGPYAHHLLESGLGVRLDPKPTFSRDLAFLIKGRIHRDCALAIPTCAKDADSLLDRGGRHLFLVPWRDYTLVGVWHRVFADQPERITVQRNELQSFIDEVSGAYPEIHITAEDILTINTGLTLFGSKKHQGELKMSFGKRSMLIDHWNKNRIQGLITLIGVRATTARGMAEQVINLVFKKIGKSGPVCRTLATPIWGGDIPSVPKFIDLETSQKPEWLTKDQLQCLIFNHGANYKRIVDYANEKKSLREVLANSCILKAEIVHAVRDEMAIKLDDVVFRRTELGTGERPAESTLMDCAHVMACELNWSEIRIREEIESAQIIFPVIVD